GPGDAGSGKGRDRLPQPGRDPGILVAAPAAARLVVGQPRGADDPKGPIDTREKAGPPPRER
ncbi:MAG TPA: hypothetical protein VGG33_12355, partial [Polyangia bacterium]